MSDLTGRSGRSAPQLLAISEHKKSGLILCKAFHAEFAGPGAMVSSPAEQPYKAVIAIGTPELVAIETAEGRRQAYGRRIQWGRWLYRIAEHPDPMVRIERFFAGFEGFFGRQVVMNIPAEVVASLVGVFPETVQKVQKNYFNLSRSNTAFLFPAEPLEVTTISLTAFSRGRLSAPLEPAATMGEIHQTYELLRTA
jgi:hypothetical protein